MASNVMKTPAASPLGCMTKLSECVYIYRPEAPAPATPSSATDAASPPKPVPKLIILATWMGARNPHIAKYLVQYQALYPTVPILLLRSEPRHFLLPSGNPRAFAPAVPFVRAIFPDIGTPDRPDNNNNNNNNNKPTNAQPELLLHAWSNGGAASLLHLRTALGLATHNNPPPPRARTPASPATLPPYTLVLDSSPGRFRYGAGYRAFAAGLPARGPARWLAAPLLHVLCALYWVRHALLGRGRTGPLAALARALNDAGARRAEVRRTYVYGPADRLVHWRDVEDHAEAAARGGFAAVRRERFEGGEHVAHVRVDAGRYWRVVRETWEGAEIHYIKWYMVCPTRPSPGTLPTWPPLPPVPAPIAARRPAPGIAPGAIAAIPRLSVVMDLITHLRRDLVKRPTSRGFLLAPAPARAGDLERLECVVHTAVVTLVCLQLGRACVALLVVRLLVRQRPFLAHAECAVVLGFQATELLVKLFPCEGLGAVRASSFEDDESAHGLVWRAPVALVTIASQERVRVDGVCLCMCLRLNGKKRRGP
ncbi:hypothetical protein F5144DRAFT_495194 [Chaetomium tenue]|uniref:Uncharacterized protein n=1 Tax=Chaetomium tenue TaxID=1854479 RepID=A0ACB7NW27_9PEZI|nr:hypothetical protein F5144DRAFT_495194 [Chaetomium globosum]